MASKNPMHNCIREGCNKRLKQSSLRRLWRVVRSDWFWPSGWNKRPNEFFLCRGCNSSRTDLQRVDSERTTTRATGPPAAPPRSVRRQPEAASLALPLQRELPESPPASPTRSDMGADEGPSGPESSPASPTQSDPGGTDGPPGRKRASAAGGEDGRRKRMRPAERRSGKKRSEEERSEEGRSEEEEGEEEEEEEDGDDDDDDCAFYYEEGEPPVSSLPAGGLATVGYDAGDEGGGAESENEGPPSRTSQPRVISLPLPPPRKGGQANVVRADLASRGLLLENGQHAADLGKRDPGALGRALAALRVALHRIATLEDERAQQDEAVKELSRAGLEDLFKELALSVLYGKYPLTHGVWRRLLDTLANM